MTFIERRGFLGIGGGAALMAGMTLAGCGGGTIHPPVAMGGVLAQAVDTDGLQYRTVARTHTLVIRQRDGSERAVGGVGRVLGKLNAPSGVAVLDGLVYVVESGNHRVQVFDAAGNAIGSFGEGAILYPSGIAAGRGELFVSDSRNARIVGFTPDGEITRILGAGKLSAPRGIEVVEDGLIVSDPGLRKVLRLGFDGHVLLEYGSGWVLPWDATTDGSYVYVADVSRNELGVTTLTGDLIEPVPLNSAPASVWFRKGELNVRPHV